MKKVVVEVRDDASRPEGGYAVVLLRGVETMPDRVVFRLKPVEARGNAGDGVGDWPSGDLRPLAVRQGDAGIELVIGPDIVDCPALIPGTLGVIEVNAAGVRGEFLWPSLRPTARPRRRTLTVVKPPARAGAAGTTASQRNEVATTTSARTGGDVGGAGRIAAAASAATAPALDSRAAHAEAPAEAAVAVTALDHATPASASAAEAVGGNVVSFNVAREALATGTDKDGTAGRSEGLSGRDDVDRLEPRELGWWPPSVRATGIAAAAAVIVSGGFLMFGQSKPAERQAAGQASVKRDRAVIAAPATPTVAAVQPPQPLRREETAEISAPETLVPSAPPAPVAIEPAAVIDAPAPAPRQSAFVQLRMRGGGFQISGEFKGFDGTKYLIDTPAGGLMTLDAARFECDGEACARPAAAILPLSERPSPAKPDQFRIEGAPALTAAFAPQLIRDYAASIGATARELPRDGGNGSPVRYRIADQRGTELATIDVVASGSAPGVAALERGTAAIALIDRPNTTEVETRVPSPATPARPRQGSAPPAPATPSEIFVGFDGIAVVASPATAPGALSLDHIAKIFSGQITDWFELGQPTGPIQIYLPPDGSGTLDTFLRQVMRPRNLDISRTARRVAGDAEAAEAVARDPRGIALTSFAEQRGAKAINLETTCGLIIRPTPFAVKAGEYPLVRRLSLQLPAQLTHPSARGIVRIAQSGEVQNAITAARLIDPTIAMLPIEEQGERMAWAANAPAASFDANELRQMLTDLTGAMRLSLTFRFAPGTNEFDLRSRREIARLAGVLKEPEFAGRRILLAGFTDASGKLQANMAAALKRSTQVRTALLQAAGTGVDPRLVTAKGYGPLAPLACAGAPDSARVNRRVEVWVAARDARSVVR